MAKNKSKKKKKQAKELEPQYYLSATNMKTLNYKVYYMSKKEKIAYFILAFIVGAAVGYLFYGGLGKDDFGNPTMITYILNTVISVTVGCIASSLDRGSTRRAHRICGQRRRRYPHPTHSAYRRYPSGCRSDRLL